MQAVFICLHVWKGQLFMAEEKKIKVALNISKRIKS